MSDDSSERIAHHLREVAGSSAPGSRLPSTRHLADRFGAGPSTVQRAVSRLVAEGLVDTRPGAGNFVAASRRVSLRGDTDWQTTSLGPNRRGPSPVGSTLRDVAPDVIAMHVSYPAADLLPMRDVRSALQRATRADESYVRPPRFGDPDLRAWFVRELSGADSTGAHRSAADAIITAGGQSALSAVFRGIAGPGDRIVMESPTYWGAIAAARQAGLVIVPIARTSGAPDPDELDEVLARSDARLFYAQPTFANPNGALWNSTERRAIARVVADRGVFMVEDDWAHDFGIDEPDDIRPMAADDPDGHVVYIRSLTKSLSLTLRVAAVVARGPARARIADAVVVNDLFVSPILQRAALDVVTRSSWRTHLSRVRGQLRHRRDLLTDSVTQYAPSLTLPSTPHGGLNLWLRLPGDVDAGTFVAASLAGGVSATSGDEWYPASVAAPHIRLNFGSAEPGRFAEAARILGSLC